MRNALNMLGMAVILALTPVIGGAAEVPTPPPTQSGETEEGATALDDIWHNLEVTADALKATIRIARDGSGVLVEGSALMNTIAVEAERVAELESRCATEGEACTKAKQERCPLLAQSYRNIQQRFADFDKKVAESSFPDELKVPLQNTSAQLRVGIEELKRKLEQGSCIDA